MGEEDGDGVDGDAMDDYAVDGDAVGQEEATLEAFALVG